MARAGYTGGMRWRSDLGSIRPWGARAIVVLLVAFTAVLVWLRISEVLGEPHRLYHSTDRYCSYIGFVEGRFVIHYDGGADRGLVTPRDWKFMGVSWKAGSTPLWSASSSNGWQVLDIGLNGWFAVGILAGAWSLTAWSFIVRPRLRRKRGRCVRCGYDVRGIPSSVCPECGVRIATRSTASGSSGS